MRVPLDFASIVIAGDLVIIKDSEATNYIGEEVELRGVVSEVSTNR
jgi:hypothetical protein